MPWRIDRRDERYCVIKETDGTTEKCHGTRQEAVAHMRALYASERQGREMTAANVIDICTEEEGYRLFDELQEYADAPEWIPYLPKPGVWKHPRYGEVAITPERNAAMVDNFKRSVYQERLPLDAEHQLKVSGAMGWITDMRTNEDGSADARVDWTDRGRKLLEANRFRYFSPEWYPQWTDPATEQVHKDVPIGGALTTRPFFKESALRPLVANEEGVYDLEEDIDPQDVTIVHFHQLQGVTTVAEPQAVPQATPETVSTEQYQELVESHGALEAKFSEAMAQSESYREALDKANARIAKMEEAGRRRMFGEMSADWVGDKDTHILLLSKLSEAFGDESDEVGKYIEQQRAFAAQAKESNLFTEVGISTPEPSETSAETKIHAKALALAGETGLSYHQAYSQVLESNPQLYREYLEEGR